MASFSYVQGCCEVPLIGDTIGLHFDKAAEHWPERPALIARRQNVSWTYRQLKDQVDALAAGLLTLGIEPADRVGIWSPNNAEWVITQFAAAKVGAILVNVNPAYRLSELEYALNKVGCKALVTADGFKGSDYLSMLRELAPEIDSCAPGKLRAPRVPALRTLIRVGPGEIKGFHAFAEVLEFGGPYSAALEQRSSELQFDDPIMIQFTSGTTGFAKGVTLTHHSILNNGYFNGEAQHLTEEDRVCIPMPIYQCFCNLACITHGCAMVYPAEGFDPLATLEAIAAERCTALYGVPMMFIAELSHPQFHQFDLRSLRTGLMAGAPGPIDLVRRCVSEMNMREITVGYGMTETSPMSTQTSFDEQLERRAGNVGRVHPHVEIKIVDAKGRIVPRGTPGELCTRGYNTMRGYWDEPDKTAQAIDSARWMHTGDLATMDEDGYCNIVGRLQEMVIRGGENIHQAEIEAILVGHPGVEAAQVIGVPDVVHGEELCAWIKLKADVCATAEEIRGFCDGKIARHKVPRYVRFVEGFPMTATGKVYKFAMREQIIQELRVTENAAT
jgi:fatty-acyl-CoA synthase